MGGSEEAALEGADGACAEMRGHLPRDSVTSCLCKCGQVPSRAHSAVPPWRIHPGLALGCKMSFNPNPKREMRVLRHYMIIKVCRGNIV